MTRLVGAYGVDFYFNAFSIPLRRYAKRRPRTCPHRQHEVPNSTGQRAPPGSQRAHSREESMFTRKTLLTIIASGTIVGGAMQLLHAAETNGSSYVVAMINV